MKSWDVIIWTIEDAVDVVPSSWATNERKTYLYPKGLRKDKILKQIRSCKSPTSKYSYDELPAAFKKTVYRFEDADEILNKLQYESNLDDQMEIDLIDNEEKNRKRPAEIAHHQTTPVNTQRVPQSVSKPETNNNLEYKQILRLLSDLADNNDQLLNEMRQMRYKIDNLAITEHPTRDEWPSSLPFKSEEDFRTGETYLPAKSKPLVSLLSLVGGNSMRHYISLMLKKLLCKDLALQYSGKGKKGKKSFLDTKFFHIILEAARIRNPSETETNVTQLVGFSLASAGDWDGGNLRKKTIEKSITTVDHGESRQEE